MAAQNATLNIGAMIDLAIGSPEVGVVDFNMLQMVLHCLAHQLNVLDKQVNVRGPTKWPKNVSGLTVYVTEMTLDKYGHMTYVQPAFTQASSRNVLVAERVDKNIERVTRSTSVEEQPPAPLATPVSASRVETMQAFVRLSNRIDNLELELQKLNAFAQIMTRQSFTPASGRESSPQSSTQKSSQRASTSGSGRPTTAEEKTVPVTPGPGVKTPIVDVPVTPGPGVKIPTADVPVTPGPGVQRPIADVPVTPGPGVQRPIADVPVKHGPEVKRSITGVPVTPGQEVKTSIADGSELERESDAKRSATGTDQSVIENPTRLKPIVPIIQSTTGSREEELDIARAWFISTRSGEETVNTKVKIDPELLKLMDRLNKLERAVEDCCETAAVDTRKIFDYVHLVQEQMTLISKEVSDIPRISLDYVTTTFGGLENFCDTVVQLKDQVNFICLVGKARETDNEKREQWRNTILEQIELLKIIKMDREDVEEALANKAGLEDLERKVSLDNFEIACEDLESGIKKANDKLTFQEALWLQAIEEIHSEINEKLNRKELEPVKDAFAKKIKALKDHLKHLTSLYPKVDAAGARKVLKDIYCLTCDAKVVMKMEAAKSSGLQTILPTIGIKHADPFSKKKKDAKDGSGDHLEDMKKPKEKMPKLKIDRNQCYRYCGGLHTVTSPSQRVHRPGNFLEQWGFEGMPLPSVTATWEDGKLYKMTAETPSYFNQKRSKNRSVKIPEQVMSRYKGPPTKTISLMNECRCLEQK